MSARQCDTQSLEILVGMDRRAFGCPGYHQERGTHIGLGQQVIIGMAGRLEHSGIATNLRGFRQHVGSPRIRNGYQIQVMADDPAEIGKQVRKNTDELPLWGQHGCGGLIRIQHQTDLRVPG